MLNWTSWARSRGPKAQPNDDLGPICGELGHICTLSISIKHNRTSGCSNKCLTMCTFEREWKQLGPAERM